MAEDVRPRYNVGSAGKKIAEGVFLVGPDGEPYVAGGGGGGGGGDNSDVVDALEEQTTALRAPRRLPFLIDRSGRTTGSTFEWDAENGVPITTPAVAQKVIDIDPNRVPGGFFQNTSLNDSPQANMYCKWITPADPNAVATFPNTDADNKPLPDGVFVLGAGDSVTLDTACGLSVICDLTATYVCYEAIQGA